MNSITIPLMPGEDIGALCKLRKKEKSMVLNVEYHLINKVFNGQIPTNENGFSLFPGNINTLIFSLKEYN